MVQGKTKLVGQSSLTGKSRPKGQAITQRKAAPNIINHRDRTSAAINRRNEQLMAGRLAHEGGTLAIIPKPAAVTHYDGSRAATTVKQHKQLLQSNIARHTRMKREGMAVGERGKREKKGGEEGAVGEKRKRGLEGVTRVGDEWFDERDAGLEALVYESEDGSEEEESKNDKDGPDAEQDGTDLAEQEEKKQEERKEAEKVAVVGSVRNTSKGKEANGTQTAKAEKKTAVKVKGQSAAVVADVKEDKGDSVQATKRAKALLGGWFAQRDSKR